MSRLLVFEWEKLEVYQSACQNFARSETSHLERAFKIFYSIYFIHFTQLLFTLFFCTLFAILMNLLTIIVFKLY